MTELEEYIERVEQQGKEGARLVNLAHGTVGWLSLFGLYYVLRLLHEILEPLLSWENERLVLGVVVAFPGTWALIFAIGVIGKAWKGEYRGDT